MIRTKATGYEFLRKVIKERGEPFEKAFLAQLSPEELNYYHKAMPINWVDIELLSHTFEVAAKLLYPHDPLPMRQFGREEAKFALGGIYKIFLRCMNVSTIIEQVAKLWRVYYEKGNAHTENVTIGSGTIVVEDFEELPKSNRIITLGYSIGGLEIAGAKDVKGLMVDTDPKSWKWIFTWH